MQELQREAKQRQGFHLLLIAGKGRRKGQLKQTKNARKLKVYFDANSEQLSQKSRWIIYIYIYKKENNEYEPGAVN